MKYIKYFWYVLRHKWFVFIAGLKFGVPLWNLIVHDWSKFTPREWSGYMNWFYGNVNDENRDYLGHLFDVAWNHHQKKNPHHWNYWILVTDSDEPRLVTLPMPDRYRREMISDWSGAGRAITGKWEVRNWYIKNRDKIMLHPETRKWVDKQLHVLENLEQKLGGSN